MADETPPPPMSDEELAEIRASLAETHAQMHKWYTEHPNPQWRREHPFDYDSIVANTYTYITMPALLAEVDRLRAREAAAMAIVQAVDTKGVYFTLQNGRRCFFCDAETAAFTSDPPHMPDCPVTKARALLANAE